MQPEMPFGCTQRCSEVLGSCTWSLYASYSGLEASKRYFKFVIKPEALFRNLYMASPWIRTLPDVLERNLQKSGEALKERANTHVQLNPQVPNLWIRRVHHTVLQSCLFNISPPSISACTISFSACFYPIKCLLLKQPMVETYFGQLFFTKWTVWIMVQATFKAFQAECMSTGSSDRLIE